MFDDISIKEHICPNHDCVGFRVVEDQQYISTRPLVDSNTEHEILEKMLEDNKPPNTQPFEMSDAAKRDYLLFTPFRYPPLLSGTRYGRQTERSIFYGSMDLSGAFAEIAHQRFRFLDDTDAKIPPVTINYTSFKFFAGTELFIDLTKPPFNKYRSVLTDKYSYKNSQKLGSILRHKKIELFYFFSARSEQSTNIAIFSPSVFTKRTSNHKHWQCVTHTGRVEFSMERKVLYKFSG
ncbi:MAG: hypothetical protein COV35_06250 [Alphaproteobacteria bacterium CG11_big_fil_rev_8_21_14_0_20_39_49]|nr:MAG: hypothetical protein COV35_06250 [Alphaproteobacteria bacterium CG11_big_fil_rev_8_21_14_0_20_39_49]